MTGGPNRRWFGGGFDLSLGLDLCHGLKSSRSRRTLRWTPRRNPLRNIRLELPPELPPEIPPVLSVLSIWSEVSACDLPVNFVEFTGRIKFLSEIRSDTVSGTVMTLEFLLTPLCSLYAVSGFDAPLSMHRSDP